MLLKYLVRIKADLVRIPLLVLWFPIYAFDFMFFFAIWHPNKRRLLEPEFWWWGFDLWLAGCMGFFVPE